MNLEDDRSNASLTRGELARYSRHLVLPEVGLRGQLKLKESSVLVVGAGGLGTPAATYLAAAGVGKIGIIDNDVVETTNLHRQVQFTESDLGLNKAEVLGSRLRRVNPHIHIQPYTLKLDSTNALEIIKDYDVVVDGTDNFQARYLINDACILLNKPDVYASVFRFDGQVSVFYGRAGPCYRCLYPEPPPVEAVQSCAEGGVLGVLPSIMGSIQAAQALNLLLGIGHTLVGRLLLFDAESTSFEEISIKKDTNCLICGPNATIKSLIDYEEFCGARQEDGIEVAVITPEQLKAMLADGRKPLLLDVREPQERTICHIPDSKLIPFGSLREGIKDLDKESEIVVYCHTGVRSARAIKLLKNMGFKNVKSLQGGIKAWAEKIDPTMPTY